MKFSIFLGFLFFIGSVLAMPQNNGQDAMRNALDQLIDGATSVKKDSGKSLGKGILNSIYSGMELGRQTKNGR
jgi:hypothetical protein